MAGTGLPAAGTSAPGRERARLLVLAGFAIYLLFGIAWVGLSVPFHQHAIDDPASLARAHAWKGYGFVLVSGAVVALLVWRLVAALLRSQEVLRESDERYRLLVESSPDMIGVHVDGTIVYVNPAGVAMLGGTSADEVIGRPISDFVHPDFADVVEERVRRTQHLGEHLPPLEQRIVRLDGEVRVVEVAASPIIYGNVPASQLVVRDITERKRTEAVIRASEARFRLMVEGSEQVFFYEHDCDHRFTYLSPSVEAVLGYRPEELLGTPYDEVLDDDPANDVVHRLTERAIRTGERAGAYTARTRHHDGRTVVLELVETPVERDGHVIGVHGFARDITERVRAEEALRESEERYRTILEEIEDGYYETDRAGRLTFFNRSFERILGRPAEELEGKRYREYMGTENARRILATLRRVYETGTPARISGLDVVHPDGTRRAVETSVTLVRDRDGTPVGFRGIVWDVTERVRLEDQLRQAQRMEAVGRLAGGIAHDFNNVLTALQGHAQLALEQMADSDPARDDLLEIQKNAERAANLTRQLLAFSRRQVVRPELLDLNDVVRGMKRMLDRLIAEDVILETSLAPDLPRVLADPGQIEQVVMNLAVNARDALPGGGTITIRTAVAELTRDLAERYAYPVAPGPYVVLSVSDTGKGMDAETQSRVFEPFFTTKEQGKGTGLGLATVYGIVKQSGGYIWVRSEPDQGSTFEVYLPPATEAAGPIRTPVARAPGDAPPPNGGATVLVVEDELPVRNLIRRVLVRRGYQVLEARNGSEALRIAAEWRAPIHLILTDVIMPEMGGPDLAEQIRGSHPEAPLLFMSGYTEDEVIRRGISHAEVAFLEKPFTPETLVRKVQETIAGG